MGLLACSSKDSDATLATRLEEECLAALAAWDGRKVDSCANIMLSLSEQNGSELLRSKALFFLGSYREDADSVTMDMREQCLSEAEELASHLSNDTLLCRIYNSRGVWELSRRRNYFTSRELFLKALKYARATGEHDLQVKAESNISESCRLLGDTIGLEYDRDLFEYAIRTGDEALAISSGLHCAEYLVKVASDTSVISAYIAPLRRSEIYSDYVPTIYAAYWYENGEYKKALKTIEEGGYTPWHQTWLLKAKILNALGKPDESNDIVEDLLSENNDKFYDALPPELYRLKASNLYELGRYGDAYRNQLIAESIADSLRSRREEDKLRWLKIEYEVDKKNAEIKERKEREVRMRNITIGILIIAVIGFCLYLIYDRKRQRFYKDIVLKNREFIAKENELLKANADIRQQLEQLQIQQSEPPTHDPQPVVSAENAEVIYAKIKYEVEENQIWRDKTITRESFADRVGCNRTYFSEVVKMKTGMTYSNYMNQLRINEAVRLLSDPSHADEISLRQLSDDLGFISLSTFYAAFKKIVGMTPAIYKKTSGSLLS
ncbi:MAG: helix-turn-helix transcriptional regulator [Bacteroides sp.]|nr:helix-turn-helix transcriptional regulator [Bacteroides sp.]